MGVSWGKGYRPDVICDELNRIRSPGDDRVALSGWLSEKLLLVISDALDLPPSVPNHVRFPVVKRGVLDAIQDGEVSPNALTKSVYSAVKSYLALPERPMTLKTSLAAMLPSGTEIRRRYDSSTIRVHRGSGFYSKQQMRALTLPGGRPFGGSTDPPRPYGANLSVTVVARTPLGAYETAFRRLDVWRALWTLAFTYKQETYHLFDRPPAVGPFRVGPVFTIHERGGQIIDEHYQYDPNFRQPPKCKQLKHNDIERIVANERNFRRWLRRSTYRETTNEFLRRYVRALDNPDLHESFLHLWALLEAITGPPRESHKDTIDRAKFAAGSWDFAIEILKYLRNFRNALVHEANIEQEIEHPLAMLKWFVDEILIMHMKHRFINIQEAFSYLRLPRSSTSIDRKLGELERKKVLLRRARMKPT